MAIMKSLDQPANILPFLDKSERRAEANLRNNVIHDENDPRRESNFSPVLARRFSSAEAQSWMRMSTKGYIFLMLVNEYGQSY